MAEITLASYIGHIFLEIIKAREMADEYSRQVALRYASDDVLRHFSTPRFKASNIDLTIPVLISNASYSELGKFTGTFDDLAKYVFQEMNNLAEFGGKRQEDMRFYAGSIEELLANLEKYSMDVDRDRLVSNAYKKFLEKLLELNELKSIFKKKDPNGEFLTQLTAQMLGWVRSKVQITSSKIEGLLVNPETKIVKDGSSDTSVFVVSAKMIEDGFFVHSVTDEKGDTQTIVEHD
jgi:hypothetical protein